MKRFRYRLQTKLNVVSKEEDMAKTELARCQQEYLNQVQLLQAWQQELEATYDKLRGRGRALTSVHEIISVKEYIPIIRERIRLQQTRVKQAEEELKKAQHRLLEIMKERKALEKLREKQWRQYLSEFYRQEQLVLDEVAMTRFWRVRRAQDSES